MQKCKNYIINAKTFYHQPTDSDMKRQEVWDKKNQELNRQANIFFTYRQKDSHASPKAIQQI